MEMEKRKKLGEILIEKGLLTEDQLQNALMEQYLTKEFLGTILVNRGIITETELMRTLAEQFGIPYVSIKNKYIDISLTKKLPSSFITNNKCFPIEEDELSLTLAIINPLDVTTISEAEKMVSPKKLKIVLTSLEDMNDVINRYKKYIKRSIIDLLEQIGE